MMAERFAVVMAGGSGTRFWPASRAVRPKQFLSLGAGAGAGETLLQATVRRAAAVVGSDHVLVVTSARHAAATAEQVPQLPASNVLLEPVGRNTAPCIAWASAHVRRRAPAAVIGALPADAHVGDEVAFGSALERGFAAAESGSIATIGVHPTRAETGYGYLELESPAKANGAPQPVRAFVEKPDAERARAYFESGRHLWNCGMFFFPAAVILGEIARHLPEVAAFVTDCDAAASAGREHAFVSERYSALPSISIDYGVMEKATAIVVVPAAFGWDDMGSWAAAFELAQKDAEGNAALAGDMLAIDAGGCLASARADKLVVLLGVRDLVVVDTDDALLVLPRARAQDVAKVVAALKASSRTRHL
jgi:mannose-1-phosphate guanylyltransferase